MEATSSPEEVPLSELDGIVLCPHKEGENYIIVFWLKDGNSLAQGYATEEERESVWKVILEAVSQAPFVRFHNLLFQPLSLIRLSVHPNGKECFLCFELNRGRMFYQPYDDKKKMEEEQAKITDILSFAQEIYAQREHSQVKH